MTAEWHGAQQLPLEKAMPLITLAENLVIASQDVPVPNLVLADCRHSLLATLLRNISRLNPSLNVLFTGEVEHGKHLWSIA